MRLDRFTFVQIFRAGDKTLEQSHYRLRITLKYNDTTMLWDTEEPAKASIQASVRRVNMY